MFPHSLNTSSLIAVIHNLTPEARAALFSKMGWNSEDELLQLVGDRSVAPRQDMSEVEKLQYPEYRAGKLLRLYVPPFLLVLGIFGNICSFFILRHKAMARQSTHHFLAALAVLDSCVLFVGLFRQWLGELTGGDLKNQGQWLCKAIVVLGYTCSNVAVWIIVAVTVERYIVVCHPLKASRVCNVTRAKRVVVGIVLLFLGINSHFLWTAGLTLRNQEEEEEQQEEKMIADLQGHCSSQEGHDFLITAVWPWVDAFIYGFSPFIIIMSLNVVIIIHMVKATSGRVVLQNRCSSSSFSSSVMLSSPTPLIKRRVSSNNNNNNDCSSQQQLLSLSRSSSNCSMASMNNCGGVTSQTSQSSLSSCNTTASMTTFTTSNAGGVAANSPNSLTVPGLPKTQANPSRTRAAKKSSSLNVLTKRRLTSNSSLRMTVMLLTVSFTFLITTLPMNVCVIASAFLNRLSDDTGRMMRFQLVFTVAELLMYVNHSVNFFLYCATGNKFRSEMRRLMCGKKRPAGLSFDHSHHIYCSRTCIAEGFTEIPNSETGF
ncbi:hypothetical protein ACOMHN_000996 [Nucella lapillus]